MSTRVQDGDLATQLHAWATKEMHFHPQGAFTGSRPPSPDDLKSICRGPQQADLWRFIIRHVHSVQTVKKVRGNLQLKSCTSAKPYTLKYGSGEQYSEEHRALFEQRACLLGEVTSILSEVHQLEREVGRIRSDLQAAEQDYQQEIEVLHDYGCKTCLLGTYVANCEDTIAANDTFREQVDSRISTLHKRILSADLHLRSDNGHGEDSTQLESSATRQIRESCNVIKKFLDENLCQNVSAGAVKVSKDQLWKHVEDTLSTIDIRQVITTLEQLAQQGTHALHQHTAKINIAQDAQKLKFKHERSGLLKDVSTPPSILHTVHQLLEECQMEHVMRFVTTEKHRNATHALKEAIEKTRGRINVALEKYLSEDSDNMPVARTLVQAKLDLAADTKARTCYLQEADALREKVNTWHKERDKLLAVHRKIQDFTEVVNVKQGQIQIVAKQNAGAQSRLGTQKSEIVKYIDRSLKDREAGLQLMCEPLRDNIMAEANKFATLSLPYLIHLYLDNMTKCALLDLSIYHHSHPAAIQARQYLQAILANLDFPQYKAAECIIRHCLQLKQEAEADEGRAKALRDSCHQVTLTSGVETSLDNVSELCEKVSAQDRQELEAFLPALQKRIAMTARASTECIKVKDMVQAWWDQPAQFVTPWLTVDNLTYQQWYNKWRILATKIRQLKIRQQQ